MLDDGILQDVDLRTGLPSEQLDLSLDQLLSHVDAIWYPDQVGVLELHSGPLIAIVQEHVDSAVCERLSNLLGTRLDIRVGSVGRRDYHFKGSDRWWQPETVFIMVLLDARGQNAI